MQSRIVFSEMVVEFMASHFEPHPHPLVINNNGRLTCSLSDYLTVLNDRKDPPHLHVSRPIVELLVANAPALISTSFLSPGHYPEMEFTHAFGVITSAQGLRRKETSRSL